MDLLLIILWAIVGVLNMFAFKQITKFNYFLTWIVLMTCLITNAIGG